MDISATSYRILKYLYSKTSITPKNKILLFLGTTRIEFDDSITDLFSRDLISTSKTDISIEPKGKIYFDKINDDNDRLIHEDIFSDYDYAIIKFIYHNNWGVKPDEFPVLFHSRCKVEIFEDYLYQQRHFIDSKGLNYVLNSAGIKYYILETERKQKNKHESFLHIGDKIDNSVKAGGDITAVVVTGGIKNSEIKNSFNKNKKDGEENVVAKKSLLWTKRNLYVAVFAIIVAIVIYLLQR